MQGICYMLFALTLFCGLDTTAKYLNQSLPVLQVASFRYMTAMLVMFFFVPPQRAMQVFKSKRLPLQITRSFILLCSTLINFFALRYLQLDQTTAIIFTTPFFVAIFAGPILGEWIGKFRWAAIGVGFIGVLIITQPWKQQFHWAMGVSFIGAVFYAFYSITTRILSKSDSDETTALHSNLWAALALVLFTAPLWVMPTTFLQWGLLMILGVFAGVGHWFMIKALRLAAPSTLSPYIYFQMPGMILMGFLVFDQMPALNTLIGSSIIIACGLYMLYRERVKGLQEK
jgi:drug/metabolite transporter (DMT)-like permease